jgi:hypothetical protein
MNEAIDFVEHRCHEGLETYDYLVSYDECISGYDLVTHDRIEQTHVRRKFLFVREIEDRSPRAK